MDIEDTIQVAMRNLQKNGYSDITITNLATSAAYFEYVGGVKLSEYWTNEPFSSRDEFFLAGNYMIYMSVLTSKVPHLNSWREKFDVAALFQTKNTIQSLCSLDILLRNYCYSDAFAVIRSLHSRLNFLMLFSLQPDLFDEWLQNAKDPKFLDGHIRRELENHGISTMEHIYEFSSEILHGQFKALNDLSYLKKGVFIEIPSARNYIYTSAKFFLSMMSYTILSAFIVDYENSSWPQEVADAEHIFKELSATILIPNTLKHLGVTMPLDRHCKEVGKNKYQIINTFNYEHFCNQLLKFHRSKGQRKHLGKEYCRK